MSMIKSGAGSMLVRAGVSAALAMTAVGALATTSSAVVAPMTLSATSGPLGGGNTITLQLPTTANPKFTSGLVGVQFQNSATPTTATCATNPAANAPATAVTAVNANVRFLSTTKVSIKVPSLSSGTVATWIVCAYNAPANGSDVISASATVVGKAAYLTATAPTATSVAPTSGPALGGTSIVVTGSNFPTTINSTTPLTASIGGTPLTQITAIDATHFSAVTPPHVAGSASPIQVTTNGGTVTLASAFTFKNGIVVSPQTVVGGTAVDVDIQGVGFTSLNFNAVATAGTDSGDGTSAGTNDANSHVYLVSGVYDETGYASGANKANGQKSECVNIAVISDNELICTVDAASSIDSTTSVGTYDYKTANLADGTYTITIVDHGNATAPTYKTVLSSGATLTVSDF
jgi:IPT/TIG domain